MEKTQDDRNNIDEQRRKKAENFHLNIADEGEAKNGSESNSQVINSYSGQDVKEQIARESKKSLRKRDRAQKKELRKRNRRNRRIFRVMWIISVILIGTMISTYVVTGMNDLLAINRPDDTEVSVKIPADPTLESVTELLRGEKNPSFFQQRSGKFFNVKKFA